MGTVALRTGVPRCDSTRVRVIADARRSGAVGVRVGIGAHSFVERGEDLWQRLRIAACRVRPTMDADAVAASFADCTRGGACWHVAAQT